MSVNAFARGLSSGITSGIELGNAITSGMNTRGVQDANAIYAEMMTMAPGQAAPPVSAIPTEGGEQAADAVAPVGYDGVPWANKKGEYLKAMKKVSDPDMFSKMEKRMADLEKTKIMENGRLALAAIAEGRTDEAQKFLANISFYTDPGTAPNISVQPDGTVVVKNEDDNKQSRVLTPNNLADFLHQMEGIGDWRKFSFDREQHSDLQTYRQAQLAREDRRLDLAERGEDRADRVVDSRLKQDEVDLEQSKFDLEKSREEWAASVQSAERDTITKVITEANEYLDKLASDPDTLNDVIKSSEGDDLIGDEVPPTVDEEIGDRMKRGAALSSGAAQARAAEFRSDPEAQAFAAALIEGLGRADADIPPRLAALLAYNATTDPGYGETARVEYEPDKGAIRVGHGDTVEYFPLHPSMQGVLGGFFSPQMEAMLPGRAGVPPLAPPEAMRSEAPQNQPNSPLMNDALYGRGMGDEAYRRATSGGIPER